MYTIYHILYIKGEQESSIATKKAHQKKKRRDRPQPKKHIKEAHERSMAEFFGSPPPPPPHPLKIVREYLKFVGSSEHNIA